MFQAVLSLFRQASRGQISDDEDKLFLEGVNRRMQKITVKVRKTDNFLK